MKDAILSIDQGTTSSRAIVFSVEGEIIASAQMEHKQIYPKNSWVEHNADEIWKNVLNVCNQALVKAKYAGYLPCTLGITNQRETIVAWNKNTGEVLHNAIVWQDKRTTDYCKKLQEQHQETVKQKTGLPLDPYFSASKINWLINNCSKVKQAVENGSIAFGTMDSFLLYKLTGNSVHATDVTNACRTLLFNIHTARWDEELLKIFEVPMSSLPKVHENTFTFGLTKPGLLEIQLPIQGMAGDQQAALIGQACFNKGDIKSTYGTGCFAMLNTGKKPVVSEHGLLTTVAYSINGTTHFALEGSIFIAGAVVQWLRDQLGIINHAQETEQMAITAEQEHPDDELIFIPAFAGLGAPHWRPEVKASILGMTLSTNKNSIVKAALESISLQTYDLIKAMEADSNTAITNIKVDGGLVNNNWLMQNLADILQANIIKPKVIETTALGAAFLAGIQNGLYQDVNAVAYNYKTKKQFTCGITTDKMKHKIKKWQQAVSNS